MESDADTLSPEYREHPPRSSLKHAERSNPDVVWDGPSKLTARKARIHSGEGRLPEANAGRRKAKGNHNLPDRLF